MGETVVVEGVVGDETLIPFASLPHTALDDQKRTRIPF
jgi:hypothetical protein